MSKLKTVALKSYCGIYIYISIYASIARAISFTRFARAFILSSPLPNAHPLFPFTFLAFKIARCDDSSSRDHIESICHKHYRSMIAEVCNCQYLYFVISRLTYECSRSHRDTRLVREYFGQDVNDHRCQ